MSQELPKILPLEQATKVIQSSEYVNHGLPVEYLAVTIRVYVESLQLIWYVLIPMSGLGFIASLFVKHHSIRSHRKAAEKKEKEERENAVVVDMPTNTTTTKTTTTTTDEEVKEKYLADQIEVQQIDERKQQDSTKKYEEATT